MVASQSLAKSQPAHSQNYLCIMSDITNHPERNLRRKLDKMCKLETNVQLTLRMLIGLIEYFKIIVITAAEVDALRSNF